MRVQLRKSFFVVSICLSLAIFALCYYERPVMTGELSLFASSVEGTTALLEELSADDPSLITFVRERVLVPPSGAPYNLVRGPSIDPSDGQARIIDSILGRKRDGFFVESGAYTGDVQSNSLFFETQRGWKGLLIEPDKKNFQKLLTKNRKVFAAHSCLGVTKTSQKIVFAESNGPMWGHILDTEKGLYTGSTRELEAMTCFPLESFLLAMNRTSVDYLSLDVEGAEYKVLQATNWDKIDIKTLSVEWNVIPEGKDALLELMESKGYIFYMEFNTHFAHDFIFVKKGEFPEIEASNDLPIVSVDYDFKQIVERPGEVVVNKTVTRVQYIVSGNNFIVDN